MITVTARRTARPRRYRHGYTFQREVLPRARAAATDLQLTLPLPPALLSTSVLGAPTRTTFSVKPRQPVDVAQDAATVGTVGTGWAESSSIPDLIPHTSR
jgi:hypothetical protein